MVVTDISPGRPFKLKGVNIYNGEKEKYSEEGGWYVQYGKYIAIGDTVIKRENELLMRIHKRDSILVFSLDCEEKGHR
ncbi:hypothetical protein CLV58_102293 [Spirosoma oryzae]|uniref:Uncharacterized protein n=2 Tax=Spirosoma oryzae TaxID=1469603 RepID=A0A2T0TIK4_9BACT|nr:hypothetical protein CLV58_102293 [Spirosoma oryzae]